MSPRARGKPQKVPSSADVDPTSADAQRDSLQIVTTVYQAWLCLSLNLLATTVLQSCLSPVYGHLAASQYFTPLTISALVVACFTYRSWNGTSRSWAQSVAVISLSAPTISIYLFRYSGQLGPRLGSLVIGISTTFPMTLISAVAACKGPALKNNEVFPASMVRCIGVCNSTVSPVVNAVILFVAHLTNKRHSGPLIQWMSRYLVRSRLGCYYLLALFQAFLFPSKYLLFVIVPLIHSVFFTGHIPFQHSTDLLNATLHNYAYSLVARQDSNTGYISVLDNIRDGFRVMRCDHSLLGGEWFPQPGHEHQLREPVYAIFVMLEAVRLIQPASGVQELQDRQENALIM